VGDNGGVALGGNRIRRKGAVNPMEGDVCVCAWPLAELGLDPACLQVSAL